MKFICQQQDFLSAIQTVQKISEKNISPISQYIYIETNKYNINVVGSKSDQTVITDINADIKESGNVLAPSNILRDIISKMPSTSIEIDVNQNNVMTVKYINMKYDIQCISADGFVYEDSIEENTSFSIKIKDFKECIKQTYFTASLQESYPVLSGILIKCENGVLNFVSTDRTRISVRTITINEKISFEIIVPSKIIFDVMYSSNKYDNEYALITFNSKYIKIKSGNITLITGLLIGKYINYKSIIPNECQTQMICDRLVFLSILERAVLLSDENLYAVKFDIKYSKLTVTSNSMQGEGLEELQVMMKGNSISVAFNSKNFIEILKNIDYDLLKFEFTTDTRICKITPVETDCLLYLITPIKT